MRTLTLTPVQAFIQIKFMGSGGDVLPMAITSVQVFIRDSCMKCGTRCCGREHRLRVPFKGFKSL